MEELDKPMYYGATTNTVEKAKKLRRNMTKPEEILWEKLKGKQVHNVRFRRQHPIDIFIADFYCHKAKLIVEVDGKIHDYQKEYDEGRTEELKRFGIKVIRFTNAEVEKELETVIERIREEVKLRI